MSENTVSGAVGVSTHPTASAHRWRNVKFPHGDLGDVLGVDCPSRQLCVALTDSGLVLSTVDPAHGRWHRYPLEAGPELTGVSCPTASLCVAVDVLGDVLTSEDPSGGTAAWHREAIDQGGFKGISCPTSTLCVAVDGASGIVTSTDPTGGAAAWTRVPVKPSDSLYSVDCPSRNLCLAGGGVGTLFTSTNPTGGASAWSGALIDPYKDGSLGGPALDVVTCPSTAFCLVGDSDDNVLGSTSPTGAKTAWHKTSLPRPDADVTGASCPSMQLCVVTDNSAQLYSSTDPSDNPPTWQPQLPLGSHSGVACSSTTLCLAFDRTGFLASRDPTGGQTAWQSDGADSFGNVTDISCLPNTATCVAVDDAGNVLTSR